MRLLACLAVLALPAMASPVQTVPGMPPVIDPGNLYSETTADKLSPAVTGHRELVYVPNVQSNDMWVIDPKTLKVIDKYKVGKAPQHVVPSWDMQTLWVTNNAERTKKGSLTAIDPKTGKAVREIPVHDPYNMYFSPDGKSAIIVEEAEKRLAFRDPTTLELQYYIEAPKCKGLNHADFSIDGRYAVFTCEFAGTLAKIDLVERKVVAYLKLSKGRMPQDIRISPDGRKYYVADMHTDGLFVIDGETFKETGFVKTGGEGPHGLNPSRDGRKLYITHRGSKKIHGEKGGAGSVAVMDFATEKIDTVWKIPGGGSPDMGNLSADGRQLWLSGRFDHVVYVIDTTNGDVKKVKLGIEPHGLTVWPQPGRASFGHTGNMR